MSRAYVPGEEAPRGRGSAGNPPNRFERLHFEADAEDGPEGEGSPAVRTELYRDSSRTVLARNDSPDIPFAVSLNPYRGCEHGCAYCYARPTHEYLGFSAGLDFETKLMVKEDAPALLRQELSSRRWIPQTIALSGVTDAYQPVERKLSLTRRCLEVLLDFRNPVGVITKNELVTRDADLLGALAGYGAAAVSLSITTLDPDLAHALEPRASGPARRLAALASLSAAGIPCGVMIAPVIPGLNDHEIPGILSAAWAAGARAAGTIPLRLPYGVKDLFRDWLERNVPLRAGKVLARLMDLRGGRLNDPEFGSRMRGEGAEAEHLKTLFEVAARKAGFGARSPALSAAAFRVPGPQLSLFA